MLLRSYDVNLGVTIQWGGMGFLMPEHHALCRCLKRLPCALVGLRLILY